MGEGGGGPPYLDGHSWSTITREERAFCAVLWHYLRNDPTPFLELIRRDLLPDLEIRGTWEAGFEVCLYRDFLKWKGREVKTSRFSEKRTFDLVLFGAERILIVEAKAQQGLDADQVGTFSMDPELIRELLGRPHLKVDLILLTSQAYVESSRRDRTSSVARFVEGRVLSWQDIHRLYPDPMFIRANESYGK